MPIVLEEKKNKRPNNKKKETKNKNTIYFDEMEEENSISRFFEGDEVRHLKEGERVVGAWSFL